MASGAKVSPDLLAISKTGVGVEVYNFVRAGLNRTFDEHNTSGKLDKQCNLPFNIDTTGSLLEVGRSLQYTMCMDGRPNPTGEVRSHTCGHGLLCLREL